MASRSGASGLLACPRGRTTNNFYPVCVVPDMFALNVSTQQASGGRTTLCKTTLMGGGSVVPTNLAWKRGYGPAMKVIEYYLESWRRFRDLQGRTTRPAFWWPFLIHPIVFLVLGGIFAAILGLSTDQTGPEVVYAIAYAWVLITLGVRRLHDMGRKGRWLLLGFVPFGNLVLLYWLVQPSTSEISE